MYIYIYIYIYIVIVNFHISVLGMTLLTTYVISGNVFILTLLTATALAARCIEPIPQEAFLARSSLREKCKQVFFQTRYLEKFG